MEMRGHSYTSLKTVKTPNNDGTYTENISETCETCNYIHNTTEVKEMTFTKWHYNKETKQDEREALELDYKETREHIDNFVIYKTDDNYEYQKCLECGQTLKVTHNFDQGVIKNNKKIYTCTNEDCGYTKTVNLTHSNHHGETSNPTPPPHTHSYEFDHYDNNFEYWICKEDNDTITKNHNLQEIKNSDGSTTYSCTNESCTYNYLVPKEHVHSYTELYSKNENNEVWKCPDDDSKITKEHQAFKLNPDPLAKEETWTCDSCGYEKKIPHSMLFTSSLDDDGELWSCTTENCGYTETKEHNLDAGTIDKEKHGIDYKCNTCEYTKFEYIPNHQFKFSSNDLEAGETWICDICEISQNKSHDFIKTPLDTEILYTCSREECGYSYVEPHIHSLIDKKIIVGSEEHCQMVTPTCRDCGFTKEPYYTDHIYEEIDDEIICINCGRTKTPINEYYEISSDTKVIPIRQSEELKTEEYTPSEKTYGLNIYYKSSSVPTEDKPLTLTLRKKDERGNY